MGVEKMAIYLDTLSLVDIGLKEIGQSYGGLKMCELGNQRMKDHSSKVAKTFFQEKGVEHLSIDINCQDRSIPLDLTKDIPIRNYFDMVTNYGTAEHVIDQRMFFQNIHNMVRVGGVMVHLLPTKRGYEGHCEFYYTTEFIEKLSKANHYRIVVNECKSREKKPTKFCIWAVLVKEKDTDFIWHEG